MRSKKQIWIAAMSVSLCGLLTTLQVRTHQKLSEKRHGTVIASGAKQSLPRFFTVSEIASSPAAPRNDTSQTASQAYLPKAQVQAAFGKLPLYFIENQGQLDAQVNYYVQGRDTSVYFTAQGITFALSEQSPGRKESALQPVAFTPQATRHRYALKLDFVGANPDVTPHGQELTPATINYFKGPQSQWQTGLKTYRSIVYRDLWPGIDLVYSGTVDRLKYTFVVNPGADPAHIKLAYRGATDVRLTNAGQLAVRTPVGGFEDDRPYSYQESEGQRTEVDTAYAVTANDAARTYVYGFQVGDYDRRKPLIIDPAVLVYASYIGGSAQDEGNGIAVDSAGNAYVTGFTLSSGVEGFPLTVGPDLTHNGNRDAFVVKITADGNALDYVGYIGGSNEEIGNSIAVDSMGNAYITGLTTSTEAEGFPVTIGPDLSHNGDLDVFVAKVTADGSALEYAGYIGGNNGDQGTGITVDSTGNAYITGFTQSTQTTFPDGDGFGMIGSADPTHNGGLDAFAARVTASGAVDFASYIGGSASDIGTGVAVATDVFSFRIFVTGNTASTQTTFPDGDGFGTITGPDQTHNGGVEDAFVAVVGSSIIGSGFLYAGYIGGSSSDRGNSIALDSAAQAYITGETHSTEATFPNGSGFASLMPSIPGPDQTYNGQTDAFVAKVKTDGSALVYAGYISGSDFDSGTGIAVDSAGNAYVTGDATSTEGDGFPVTVGPDLTHNGGIDAFIAKVNPGGSALDYAGYIGGSGIFEMGRGIAVDSAGNAYVTGRTDSTETTFPDGDGFGAFLPGPDQSHNGHFDAFVVKVAESPDADNDGFAVAQGDCDDTNAAINPGAPDFCGDSIDQDCNGSDLGCLPENCGNCIDDNFNGLTDLLDPACPLTATATVKRGALSLDPDSDEDKLMLNLSFVRAGVSIDPPTEGVTMSLYDASGLVACVAVPGGQGWTMNKPETRWSFKDPRGILGQAGKELVTIQCNPKQEVCTLSANLRENNFVMNAMTRSLTTGVVINNDRLGNTQVWRSVSKGKRLVTP